MVHREETKTITIAVFPGVGGDDAKDWAQMLLAMYAGYAKTQAWRSRAINDHTLEVVGDGSYDRLRLESGVHRLVRVSPYDAKKLRHTSFALVEVLPELHPVEAERLTIPEKDLKLDFHRSAGPGGQNVNKVETAVRIVHLPTGIAVSSQAERSQQQNRERAMALLKAKLVRIMAERRETELSNLRVKVAPEWSNQIRSYVLHPYQKVKDHRTMQETSRVDDVLAGKLDTFIEAEVELDRLNRSRDSSVE